MRKLGFVIAAASAVVLAGILFLAFVVPPWLQEAREAGRQLPTPEAVLHDLSQLATRIGLPGLLVAALGLAAGLVLVRKGGTSRPS
jgi:type II secretory pathway component PulF